MYLGHWDAYFGLSRFLREGNEELHLPYLVMMLSRVRLQFFNVMFTHCHLVRQCPADVRESQAQDQPAYWQSDLKTHCGIHVVHRWSPCSCSSNFHFEVVVAKGGAIVYQEGIDLQGGICHECAKLACNHSEDFNDVWRVSTFNQKRWDSGSSQLYVHSPWLLFVSAWCIVLSCLNFMLISSLNCLLSEFNFKWLKFILIHCAFNFRIICTI